jgi:BioD-like phosphotransacetylase family protein
MEEIMTTTVYVTSTQHLSGKSALCVGLLKRFKRDGFIIGYMKPVSTTAHVMGEQVIDEDARFIRSTFELTDPLETMAPLILTDQKVATLLSSDERDLSEKVRSAFEKISSGKEIVLLEGAGSFREGWIVNLAPVHVCQLLNAKSLVIVPYGNDLQVADDLITARVQLGDSLIGGVINRVPQHRMDFVSNKLKPFVERDGIPVFAVLPKKRILLSVSVKELNEGLMGEVLCAEGALNELVEHLVVGAMGVERALKYLRQNINQAVITGGDRSDIQLAALETSTRCLILTGNIRPGPQIISRAEDQGVPIILTRHDTMTAIERIERFFGKTRFHQEEKVQRFDSLLEQNMDFEAFYRALGID